MRFARLFDIGSKHQLCIFLHRRRDPDMPDILRIATCDDTGGMWSFDIPFFVEDQADIVMEAIEGEEALFFCQFIGRQLSTIVQDDIVYYLDDPNDVAYTPFFCESIGIDYVEIEDESLSPEQVILAAKIIRDQDGPYVELREVRRPPGDKEVFRINKNGTEERFCVSHAVRRVSSMAFASFCIELQKLAAVLNSQEEEEV